MDWPSIQTARARKEPPDKGGWNLLHTEFGGTDVVNPAIHFGVSGAGPDAWVGWPNVPQLEGLITGWVQATDQTKRKQLAAEVQKVRTGRADLRHPALRLVSPQVALSEVTYVPYGEWFQPTAFRKNVRDVLKFAAPIFWNMKVT
jgi:peptide/nickel transport system substrate-binding protein